VTKHPLDRAARRRSAQAKALEKLRPKKIDGKKRKIIVDLKEKETKDELRILDFTDEPRVPVEGRLVDVANFA
jgi:hypothetical protein